MRICIIGKFPPIQGGVSMRTYLDRARARGARSRSPRRHQCQGGAAAVSHAHAGGGLDAVRGAFDAGSVTVHWTDPVDRSQSYIPMASPFVSKLAAIAANAHSVRPFDVIFSHYMEPYGVAGHLAAQMTGVPHVVRMAGSDAGRLWHHPQFEALYDHVLRSADIVVAAGVVARTRRRARRRSGRIVSGGGYVAPEESVHAGRPGARFRAAADREVEQDPANCATCCGATSPATGLISVSTASSARTRDRSRCSPPCNGSSLPDWTSGLSRWRTAGRKSSSDFAERVARTGPDGSRAADSVSSALARAEFLRGCLAVCCLEQDFPIGVSHARSSRSRCCCAAGALSPRPR